MWTLALETTTAQPSLALLNDDQVVGLRQLEAQRTAATMFGAITSLLAESGLELEAVDLFAVADGPGSFTGVRLGLTAVKGFVEVLSTPAVAVSTLKAVASGLGDTSSGQPSLAALDAGRSEIYYGIYPAGDEGLEPLTAFRQRLSRFNGRAATSQPQLQSLCPELQLVEPNLAPAVGRLGLSAFRTGAALDALRLDARYLRRSDAELMATQP